MMSWALTYYLTRNQNIGRFYAFLGELNKLPRDLRISKEAYLKLFCESFNLMKADKSAIDDRAFADFASGWIKAMNELPPSWKQLSLTEFQRNQQGVGGPPTLPPGGLGGGPGGPLGGGDGGDGR